MTKDKYNDGYEDEEESEEPTFTIVLEGGFAIDDFVQSSISPDYIGIVTGLLIESHGVSYQVAWGPQQEGQVCTAVELLSYMDNVDTNPN